jgi:hypothetical protein
MRATLAAICAFTLLATAYLTASLLILRPPRANFQQWALIASVIVGQGALTLMTLRTGSSKGLRYMTLAGGVVLAVLGARWVYGTVAGPHFEGYVLVLGCASSVQGLLTLATFARLTSVAD